MLVAFMLLGVVSLVASVAAWRANRAFALTGAAGPRWRNLYRFWWAPGMLLGAASYFIAFPYTTSERYMVHGFPFPAYAFDASGHDYVGFITLPFMLINFACWFFVVHVAFWLARRHGV